VLESPALYTITAAKEMQNSGFQCQASNIPGHTLVILEPRTGGSPQLAAPVYLPAAAWGAGSLAQYSAAALWIAAW
jgi:hypothetical protein